METISNILCFGGEQIRFTHNSKTTNCEMTAAIYLPPQAKRKAVPVLFWLSGLTCNDENFSTKAGAQRYAAEHGIALVMPDTSPRGESVPDDAEAAYDFGLGAGFYVDATEAPWSEHYQMYSYVTEELPALIAEHFPVDINRCSISGHSMGGHGALSIALKNPNRYRSVSAFAPIVSPLNCPWGEKALSHYLGADKSTWVNYDSCELLKKTAQQLPMLIDQGMADNFLVEQLKPQLLTEAALSVNYPLTLRMQAGYDHSYYFISSFIGEHIAFHAQYL